MVTTSVATLTLILMALVGCGPKPAPTIPVHWNPQYTTAGIKCSIAQMVVFDGRSVHCEGPLPAIDPNPYRFIGGQEYGEGWYPPLPPPFAIGWDASALAPEPNRIGGQRYGEGWDGNRIQRDGPTFKSKCGHDGECGCIGCASDGARTYCNHCDGGPFLPLE